MLWKGSITAIESPTHSVVASDSMGTSALCVTPKHSALQSMQNGVLLQPRPPTAALARRVQCMQRNVATSSTRRLFRPPPPHTGVIVTTRARQGGRNIHPSRRNRMTFCTTNRITCRLQSGSRTALNHESDVCAHCFRVCRSLLRNPCCGKGSYCPTNRCCPP